MIGNKSNKLKKGQVLLITIMVLATVLTVVLAGSFRSTTETQITKLEEESQKALAAAEAGIEAALKQGTIADIGGLPGLSGFSGSATIENIQPKNFITPLLQKDEQYTLYLSTPQGAPGSPDFTQLGEPYFNGALTLCFNGATAIEVTMIKSDASLARYIINPPSQSIVSGTNSFSASNGCPISGFSYGYTFNPLSQTKLLIARIINNATKLGFSASIPLPYQGKVVSSTAKTQAGVEKKVVLFQSYPQIPLDFFVTSF